MINMELVTVQKDARGKEATDGVMLEWGERDGVGVRDESLK